jgi:hypothetical protein
MKKSIELSFIKFLRQNKTIFIVVFLIPQLLSFGYFGVNKQDACYAEAQFITATSSKQVKKYLMHIMNEFEKQGAISYSKLRFPYLEFEGSNSQCIEDAKKAQKLVFDINLTIQKEVQKELNQYEAALKEFKQMQEKAPHEQIPPAAPRLLKDLGIDSNFLMLSRKVGVQYPIISLTDAEIVNKLKKKFFLVIVGAFVLSFLTLLTIFFYSYLFRKI